MSRNSGPIMKQNKMGHDFGYSENVRRLELTLVVGMFPFQWSGHHDIGDVVKKTAWLLLGSQ